MNNADIVGVILVVLGLLLTILATFTDPILLLVAGALIAAGIVLIVTGGIMCRNENDVEPSETPVYADAVPAVYEKTDDVVVGCALEPPLVGMRL